MKRILPWMVGVVLVLAAMVIDAWAYHHVAYRAVYDHDWGRALRDVGYWPTWAVVALAFWLHERRHPSVVRRAWPLIGSVTIAGITAELLKIIVRRERPSLHDGAYAFRAWSDRPFSSSGFGFLSSHAADAFAGAMVLSYFFPESRVLWWVLAVACGVTRLLSGAHFLSDVMAGALLGLGVATGFLHMWNRRR